MEAQIKWILNDDCGHMFFLRNPEPKKEEVQSPKDTTFQYNFNQLTRFCGTLELWSILALPAWIEPKAIRIDQPRRCRTAQFFVPRRFPGPPLPQRVAVSRARTGCMCCWSDGHRLQQLQGAEGADGSAQHAAHACTTREHVRCCREPRGVVVQATGV